MRKLIIALPRTGSTSLLQLISDRDNLKQIFEPFDGSNRVIYKDTDDDVVVKTMAFHYPNNVDNGYNWLINFSKKFDETIILNRRNFKELCESYAFWTYNKKNGFESNMEYVWKPTPNYNEAEEKMTGWVNIINSLSLDLNIPITYYEDIYDMNDSNKLRKYIDTKSITKII